MPIKMKELPEAERPYEKLEQYGAKALTNAELLAIIIKTGTKEETAVGLAQQILKMNSTGEENLSFLMDLTIEEFMKIKGIGKVKAIQLKAVCELVTRINMVSTYKEKIIKQASIKHITLINTCFIFISRHSKKLFSKFILNFDYKYITVDKCYFGMFLLNCNINIRASYFILLFQLII